MKLKDINPFVRQALVSRLTSSNKTDVFNKIRTVDCRLFYISDGNGKMRFEDEVYPLSKGTVVLFRAGTPYMWEVECLDYYAVNFDYTQDFSNIKQSFHPISDSLFLQKDIIDNRTFDDEELLNKPLVLSFAPEFEENIKKIVTEYLIGNDYSEMYISTLLKLIIINVIKKKKLILDADKEKTSTNVKQIIEYISKNYSKELSYQTLKEKFNFNPSYLNRIFKKHTGSSVYNFILNYRLNIAMEILRTQNLFVNEVAQLCGFTNPYHFTKAFTKHTGVSPTEYKRKV